MKLVTTIACHFYDYKSNVFLAELKHKMTVYYHNSMLGFFPPTFVFLKILFMDLREGQGEKW